MSLNQTIAISRTIFVFLTILYITFNFKKNLYNIIFLTYIYSDLFFELSYLFEKFGIDFIPIIIFKWKYHKYKLYRLIKLLL